MAVTTKFTGDEKDLLRAQDKIAQGAARVTNEYRAGVRAATEMETAAKRVWRETATDQERYQTRMKEINTLFHAGKISADQFHRASEQAYAKLSNATSSGVTGMGRLVGAVGGVTAAIALAERGIQSMISGMEETLSLHREIEQRGRTTMQEGLSFFALQPEGTAQKRLEQVAKINAGQMPLGQALSAMQSLQSAAPGGTDAEIWRNAVSVFREVSKAGRAGLAPELGSELAKQAYELKQDPAAFMRATFAVGQASKRDPSTVATAASALQLFDDPMFGLGIAGQLAGANPTRVREMTASAAKQLSGVSPAAEWFRQQGLPANATMEQRLGMMRQRGIDTPEELKGVGISEELGLQAMVNLVRGGANVDRFAAAARGGAADPKLFDMTLARMERDTPALSARKDIVSVEGQRELRQSFQLESQQTVLREKLIADRLSARGLNRAALTGSPLFNADGTPVSWWRGFSSGILDTIGGGIVGEPLRPQVIRDIRDEVDTQFRMLRDSRPAIPKAEH